MLWTLSGKLWSSGCFLLDWIKTTAFLSALCRPVVQQASQCFTGWVQRATAVCTFCVSAFGTFRLLIMSISKRFLQCFSHWADACFTDLGHVDNVGKKSMEEHIPTLKTCFDTIQWTSWLSTSKHPSDCGPSFTSCLDHKYRRLMHNYFTPHYWGCASQRHSGGNREKQAAQVSCKEDNRKASLIWLRSSVQMQTKWCPHRLLTSHLFAAPLRTTHLHSQETAISTGTKKQNKKKPQQGESHCTDL